MSNLKCVCSFERIDQSTYSYTFHTLKKTTPDSGCEYCVQLEIETKAHNDRAEVIRLAKVTFDSANPVIAQVCDGCGEILWSENCQGCCDHEFDPDEGYTCLNCGKDGSDYLAGMADYARDMMGDR